MDEQPTLGKSFTHQAFGVVDHHSAEDRANQRSPSADGHPDHHFDRKRNRHVLRRNDARLHGVKRSADPSQTTSNREDNRLEQRWVVAGKPQPRFVIADGDQHVTEAAPHHPTQKQPGQDHHHRSEPKETALHLRRAHHLTEQFGDIRLQTVGAIDQLLLAIEEVEKHQQGGLGEDREVDPLDPVTEHQVAEHSGQHGRNQPDRHQGEQRRMEGQPERRQLIHAVEAKKFRDAVG